MSKKKKQTKRKRFEFLSVQLNEEHINPTTNNIEINVSIDLSKGESKIINAYDSSVIDNHSIVYGYVGENKIRTLSEIPTASDDHSYNFLLKLKKYKHLVAIDTNSFIVNSEIFKTEVSLGLGVAVALLEKENELRLEPITQPFVTTFNCEKPENENWVRIIELVRNNCKCEDKRKIGIIVDSDLGSLNDYNQRLKPIYRDYFLPMDFELIFASDKAADNILNVMIGRCHSLSKALIPEFKTSLEKALTNEMKEGN